MNAILRRSVGIIMGAVALFTGIGQFQAQASADPDFSVWGWLPVVFFAWLSFLNLKRQQRVTRGRALDEDR
jgi:hypothetical protein